MEVFAESAIEWLGWCWSLEWHRSLRSDVMGLPMCRREMGRWRDGARYPTLIQPPTTPHHSSIKLVSCHTPEDEALRLYPSSSPRRCGFRLRRTLSVEWSLPHSHRAIRQAICCMEGNMARGEQRTFGSVHHVSHPVYFHPTNIIQLRHSCKGTRVRGSSPAWP